MADILKSLGQNLPSIDSVSSTITSAVSSSVSFSIANATTKISEAVKSTIGSFGGEGGPFSKIGANTPTFDQMKSAAMRAGNILVNGTDKLVASQIASEISSGFSVATASSVKAATGAGGNVTDHFVTLTEVGDSELMVQFDVMPEIVESRTVQYEAVAPSQFPGAFQKYKGTDSTQWTLNVTFIARNSTEATKNLYHLNLLRGWTMPFFGENTAAFYSSKLGAPPPVLELFGLRNLVGTVPVVITSLNWNWPKDVDYIATQSLGEDGNLIPFPAVMTIAIQLVESYSTGQFNKFSLADYRSGNMKAAFNTEIKANPPAVTEMSSESYDSYEARRFDRNGVSAGGGQSSAAFAAIDPRRVDMPMGGQSTSQFANVDPRRLDR